MLNNEKQFPKRYFARHIKEGVVHYLENGKDVIYLVKNDALSKMNKSFEGQPIFVGHRDVDLENLRENADGYVVKSFYNEFDGAWWAELMIVSDAGHKAVEKGWAVSNSYTPTAYAGGGSYHDISYEKEVLDGKYDHLAIVPDPRYEEAVIMTPDDFRKFNEGKQQEIKQMKNSKETDMLSQEEMDNLVAAVKNSLSETIGETVRKAVEAKAEEDKKNAVQEDHRKLIREIAAISAKEEGDFKGGLEEKVREVIKLAEKLGYTKDEADEDKKENESEKEEEKKEDSAKSNEEEEKKAEEDDKENGCGKKNEAEAEEEKKPEEKKENSRGWFSLLKNAKAKSQDESVAATMASGLALGKQRYGSK